MSDIEESDKPKKIEMIGLKVGAPDKEVLKEICEEHDRPLGYVARELMLRGLAAYRRDGKLKEPSPGRVDQIARPSSQTKLDRPLLDLGKRRKKQLA